MNNTTLGYVKTTPETVYSNQSGDAVQVNVHIANVSNSTVNVTLSVSSLTQGLSRGSGVPIYKSDMSTGETISFSQSIILNHKQNLIAVATVADSVTVKVDEL